MTEPGAREVSTAVWAVARPFMQTDRWCINAASLTRLTLLELGVKSFAVQATVMHLNRAYAAHVADGRDGWGPPEGEPYMVYARARRLTDPPHPWDLDSFGHDAGSPEGLAGHVLTYAPSWRAWLDPSGHQFTREAHGILIPPGHVWEGVPDPAQQHAWYRPDGGVSIIEPTPLRTFKHAAGWQTKPYHRPMVREILRLLAGD
jgi:hypothetical protein